MCNSRADVLHEILLFGKDVKEFIEQYETSLFIFFQHPIISGTNK